MEKRGDFIGVHMLHKDRLKPEFLPAGETFGAYIEVYLDKEYGAIAHIYPWKRFHEQMWDKRHREFLKLPKKEQDKRIKEQKEFWEKVEKDKKPIDTSNWLKPRPSDIKEQIVCKLFFAYLTTETEARVMHLGEINAMQWILYAKMPPKSKRVGWQNISSIGMFDKYEVKSLEGIIDMLNGKHMTTSKLLTLAIKKKEIPEEFKVSEGQDGHQAYLARAKKLEKEMIVIHTNVIDEEQMFYKTNI